MCFLSLDQGKGATHSFLQKQMMEKIVVVVEVDRGGGA